MTRPRIGFVLAHEQFPAPDAITPEPFYGVGLWYRDFSQPRDHEVRELLARAAGDQQRRAPAA